MFQSDASKPGILVSEFEDKKEITYGEQMTRN